MNTTKKFSKFLATKLGEVATHIAHTSTKACIVYGIEEPKMPQCLLKKAK